MLKYLIAFFMTLALGILAYLTLVLGFWQGLSLRSVFVQKAYPAPTHSPFLFEEGDAVVSLSLSGKMRPIFHLSTFVRTLCDNQQLVVIDIIGANKNLKKISFDGVSRTNLHPLFFQEMDCHFPTWIRFDVATPWSRIEQNKSTANQLDLIQVAHKSWADKLGLKPGDTIVSLNEISLQDPFDLYNKLIKKLKDKEIANLFWARPKEGAFTNVVSEMNFSALIFGEERSMPHYRIFQSTSLFSAFEDANFYLWDTCILTFNYLNSKLSFTNYLQSLSLLGNPSSMACLLLIFVFVSLSAVVCLPLLILLLFVKGKQRKNY